MLKHIIKKDQLLSDLEYELEIYEEELEDEGHIEIEHFHGAYSRKNYDYDLIIRIYEDEDSEVGEFHYFSYTVESDEHAERLIKEVEALIEEKGYESERLFRG